MGTMTFERLKWVKGRPYVQEVESYRESGKIKQRMIRHLGPYGRVGSQCTNLTLSSKDKKLLKDFNKEKLVTTSKKSLVTTKEFQSVVLEFLETNPKKLGDMTEAPDLRKKIHEKYDLSDEEIDKRLYDLYTSKIIDLQPGKTEGKPIKVPSETDHTFTWIQTREKKTSSTELGTTKKNKTVKKKTISSDKFENKLKKEYELINKEGRRGGTVNIPDLYREMSSDVSKSQFRKELLKLERERVIDLQTASDTKFLKNKEGSFFVDSKGRPQDFDSSYLGKTKRGFVHYVVWRR